MRALTIAVMLCAVLPMTALAVDPPRKYRKELPGQLEALGFEGAKGATRILPTKSDVLNYDAPVTQKIGDLALLDTQGALIRKTINDDDRRQPYRHFMPSLSGLTGLIDITVAYTQPKKTFVATVQHENVQADNRWWRLSYKGIDSSMTFMSLNYGATDNIELSLDGEVWDKSLTYNDPILQTNPTFKTNDLKFLGFGSKWTFPFGSTQVERLWFGLGFRVQLYDNEHRNFTEIHEYDRFSNVFFTISTKATKEIFGHFTIKYVSYDFAGGRFPSGGTPFFAGISPTNYWTQWGMGAEWYVFPDFEVFMEALQDSSVIFLEEDGTFNQFNVNAGARYHQKNFGVGVFSKRINHRGYVDHGVQAAIRF